MDNKQYFIYLIIMAVTTYLIRAVPFAMIKKKTENVTVKSFLTYIPYAVLCAMTIPAIFYAPDNMVAAGFGFVAAVICAYKKKGLMITAVVACLAVLVSESIIYNL